MISRKLLLLCLLPLLGCSGSDEVLLAKIYREIQPVRAMTTGYRVLDLDSLTDFAWDSVYFSQCDSECGGDKSILATLGWRGVPALQDGSRRLSFVRQNETVAYVDYFASGSVYPTNPPLPLSLAGCKEGGYGSGAHGIARKQAKFAVFRNCAIGGLERPVYIMVPLSCVKHFGVAIAQGCTEETIRMLNQPHLYDSAGNIIVIRDTAEFRRTGRM